jgi:predicted alpha/beta superfamily hydrolase
MTTHRTLRVQIILIGVLLLAVGTLVRAQDGGPIVVGQRVKVHSNVMNEDRMLWIYNPDTTLSSSARYPVIYLLDGDGHFLHAAGVVQFLSQNGRMPQMIIVGIANTNRTRDLTPLPADTAFPGSGGADMFLRFIKDELIPYVDSHYKTAPFRMLIGHSFGGIFAVNALLTHPEIFNSYIIVSPSLWWGKDTLVNKIGAFLRKPLKLRAFVYETVGNEGPGMVTPALRVLQSIEASQVEGLEWRIKLLEAEDHGSIVHRTIYDGMEFIFSPWRMRGNLAAAGIPGLEEHYKRLSDRYGYQIDIPELVVNGLGYQYLAQNKLEEAIAVFKWNVQHYPGSWNVYDSLGEAIAKKGDTKLAIENYEKSIALNPNNTAGIEALRKLKAK